MLMKIFNKGQIPLDATKKIKPKPLPVPVPSPTKPPVNPYKPPKLIPKTEKNQAMIDRWKNFKKKEGKPDYQTYSSSSFKVSLFRSY